MSIYEREDAVEETTEELKARKDALISTIQSIEVQLSQKDRRDPESGERMGDREFHDWRGKAVTARKHMLNELRELKAEIAKREGGDYASQKQAEQEQMDRIEDKLDFLIRHLDYGRIPVGPFPPPAPTPRPPAASL